jgi:hypothetical protein
MAVYLRFTPGEHAALASACRGLPPGLSYRAFQAALAARLREGHAELAGRVASLRLEQLRILRDHLQPAAPEAAPEAGLTWRECRELAELCSLFRLRGGPLLALFRDFLAEGAGPALAAKLALLGDGQLVALLRRAQSGVRWCP